MRALVIVLDSVGIGHAPDAARYGDEGANTLGHIFEKIPDFSLPNLSQLGLRHLISSTASDDTGSPGSSPPVTGVLQMRASYGKMEERSAGKDTTTGHWELAGAILDIPFAIFEKFPNELVHAIEQEAGVRFIGNYARSGTEILKELGAEHLQTGNPILYTSADSVLQIAAHVEVLPLKKLYAICEVARRHAGRYRIGRVIARPFEGASGNFRRTPNRHDFSMRPPPTVLNAVAKAGFPVIGIGKIGDIFAGEGITESHPTKSNADGMETIDRLWASTRRGLIFVNLVDFDMLYGHRRDPAGYAEALRDFDDWLGAFVTKIAQEDLVIITADHGNDPTFRGTDHTRERVPLLVLPGDKSRDLGTRKTFADVAASLANHFGLSEPWPAGNSFI